MIIGQVLISNAAGTAYYSPWFPSGGNEIHTTVDVIALTGTGVGTAIEVTVQTKNSEQDDDVATAPAGWTSGALGGIGRATFAAGANIIEGTTTQGLLELVRYKYEVTATTVGDGVHFRILNPTWLSNGA